MSSPFPPVPHRRPAPRPALLITLLISSSMIVLLVGIITFALAVSSGNGVSPAATTKPLPHSSHR
ncbi:hypothetical protein [Fodinicola feengrottensis]|uniref:Uncharacterized protein n=1 Tax=Fodinicola feengrottensis TaxID=435914 RepID=A0ABN2ILS9_9ACTN|nr:hypothetical protein [Fodinicola feengrottensis]